MQRLTRSHAVGSVGGIRDHQPRRRAKFTHLAREPDAIGRDHGESPLCELPAGRGNAESGAHDVVHVGVVCRDVDVVRCTRNHLFAQQSRGSKDESDVHPEFRVGECGYLHKRIASVACRRDHHVVPRFSAAGHEQRGGQHEGGGDRTQATEHGCARHDSNGADDGIRTRDPHLGKVMLYQLSHVRVRGLSLATGRPYPPCHFVFLESKRY